jgi:uncharacterized protein with PQ loop repeat
MPAGGYARSTGARSTARQGYRHVFSEGFVRDYPLAIRHISGKITEVLYNATVYKDENGDVLGVFAAARDVTERKRVEEALKEREVLKQELSELEKSRVELSKSVFSAREEAKKFTTQIEAISSIVLATFIGCGKGLEILGLIAGSVTSIGFIPQLIKGYMTKKLEDVSYFMPIVLTIGMLIWFIYGFLLNAIAIMAANIFGASCCITLIIMKKDIPRFIALM